MIIYDKRKPKTFDGANCVGITGENLAETQEFLIRGMCDITVDYSIHLRFADGSVNSVIPDSTAIDETGTKLVWKVRKNDIFMHGYFELQLNINKFFVVPVKVLFSFTKFFFVCKLIAYIYNITV